MISTVITTYKREKEIVERAMKSILAQTYTDWELIVVDDSPASFTHRNEVKNMVLNYANEDSRIRYYAHSQNLGACAARNTGLQASKGEYIAFLDDDDEWVPEKLQKQIEHFKTCSLDTALVYCGALYCNVDSHQTFVHKTTFLRGNVFDDLIVKNFVGGTSFPLIRTAFLKEIGGFDVKMAASQDLDVWLRLSEKYKVDYVEDPLVIYYIHNGERITASPKKRIAGISRKIEKHKKYFENHSKQHGICMMELAVLYAIDNNLTEAIRIWQQAFAISPFSIKSNFIGIVRILKGFLMHD